MFFSVFSVVATGCEARRWSPPNDATVSLVWELSDRIGEYRKIASDVWNDKASESQSNAGIQQVLSLCERNQGYHLSSRFNDADWSHIAPFCARFKVVYWGRYVDIFPQLIDLQEDLVASVY